MDMSRKGRAFIIERTTENDNESRLINQVPKHIVCLTFDFDVLSGFITRGQVGPSWLSRGEFGPRKERCEWGVLTYTCHAS